MLPFFIKTLIFCIGILCLDLVIFLGFLNMTEVFPPQEKDMIDQLPHRDVIIMGTSHAEQGFSPTKLKELSSLSYTNIGKARRNLFFQSILTRQLISKGHRPKFVILTATYHDWNETSHPYMVYPLANPEEKKQLFWQLSLDREWLNPRRWLAMDRYSSTARMICARSLSWLKNRETIFPWIEHGENGYIPMNHCMKKQQRPKAFDSYPLHIQSQNLHAFKSLLNQWKVVGVPVVVVDPPEFLGSRLSHRDYEKLWTMIRKICKEHDVPCESFSDPKKHWTAEEQYFRDGGWGYPNSHLNHKGTIKFNEELVDWLKRQEPLKKFLD